MATTHQLSQAAYDRLLEEHTHLKTIGKIEIAKKIETARELGDLSENGDYHAAKEEQGKMAGRLMHLASILENCEIVENDGSGGVVAAGSIIEVRYEGDTETERYLFGSVEEKNDLDVISPGSPLGEALNGAKPGDTVKFAAPNGDLKVEVVGIE